MRIAILLMLFPVTASAVLCDRIEYAEVKDWPADKIEAQYCHAMSLHQEQIAYWIKLRDQGLLSHRNGDPIMADSQSCLDQAALMRRVLMNLHDRKPICGEAKQ